METTPHEFLVPLWFCLLGIMLAFYVITDGFDLGIGILSLFTRRPTDRDAMVQSINHVWDANETWLVVLGGGLFGAFPAAYALLLQNLYVPFMLLIASLIMRGAAIEFRHAANGSRLWDVVFGVGSLLAALTQGVILGRLITSLEPGILNDVFTAVAAIGVAAGYALLGSTYLVKKTDGAIEGLARRWTFICLPITLVSALILSAATLRFSLIGTGRWDQPGIMPLLLLLGAIATAASAYIAGSTWTHGYRGPFRATIVLFLVSFAGLAVSLFPYIVPGKLRLMDAASDSQTLLFMLVGIGILLPVMIGYNLYQYYVFRGKVSVAGH